MSEPETTIAEYPGTVWDDPNRQVVRPDESAAWEEGAGGSAGEPKEEAQAAPAGAADYEGMTKAQLLELAQARGISPANNDMTKAELVAGLEADDAG